METDSLQQPQPQQNQIPHLEHAVSNKTTLGHNHLSSMILTVYISSKHSDKEIMIYALLDTQSDSTFVLECVADELQVRCFQIKNSYNEFTINSQLP
jgi:hypothetical protein